MMEILVMMRIRDSVEASNSLFTCVVRARFACVERFDCGAKSTGDRRYLPPLTSSIF